MNRDVSKAVTDLAGTTDVLLSKREPSFSHIPLHCALAVQRCTRLGEVPSTHKPVGSPGGKPPPNRVSREPPKPLTHG